MPVLVGTSAHIRRLEAEAKRAGLSSARVLITGESGVGKDIVARLIHGHSVRRMRPFIVLNCASVPDTLLESEFFGHSRGSFVGAYRDYPGVLQQAEGGTVLLDEIGEMSVRLQGVLLRFLQTSLVQRVGMVGHFPLDVRVIAANSQQLTDRIAQGKFREDLYYRLNVIHLEIAPLRERREDIEPLMRHFLAFFSERYQIAAPILPPAAVALLSSYLWPGNARELRTVAERLIVQKLAEVDLDVLAVVMGLPNGLASSE